MTDKDEVRRVITDKASRFYREGKSVEAALSCAVAEYRREERAKADALDRALDDAADDVRAAYRRGTQ